MLIEAGRMKINAKILVFRKFLGKSIEIYAWHKIMQTIKKTTEQPKLLDTLEHCPNAIPDKVGILEAGRLKEKGFMFLCIFPFVHI